MPYYHSLMQCYNQQAGCEMETRDYAGWTAIYHATSSGHQNMLLYLIESGSDINIKFV